MGLPLIFVVFLEFFKIGLFAVGGGPATIPYLMELTKNYTWFTMEELTNMIAVSESTPGPVGVNMATYVGFQTLGVAGGLVTTIGLTVPSIIVICLIAAYFKKMNEHPVVQAAFKSIRPAVAAIIAASVLQIFKVSLLVTTETGTSLAWKSIILAAAIFGLRYVKKLKKIHPFFWFVIGGIVGVIFRF